MALLLASKHAASSGAKKVGARWTAKMARSDETNERTIRAAKKRGELKDTKQKHTHHPSIYNTSSFAMSKRRAKL